jgi:hypothetical protein
MIPQDVNKNENDIKAEKLRKKIFSFVSNLLCKEILKVADTMLFYQYLLFIFLPVLSNCFNLTAKDSVFYFGGQLLKENQFHFFSENKDFCGFIVPGLQRITRGVDITKLDLFHNYNENEQDGFMSCAILDLTCKKVFILIYLKYLFKLLK